MMFLIQKLNLFQLVVKDKNRNGANANVSYCMSFYLFFLKPLKDKIIRSVIDYADTLSVA